VGRHSKGIDPQDYTEESSIVAESSDKHAAPSDNAEGYSNDANNISSQSGKTVKSRRFSIVSGVVLLVVVLFAGAMLYHHRNRHSYPDFEGPGTGSVLVEVTPGASAASLAPTLVEMGVVKSTGAFIQAANDNPRITSMQPGYYQLRKKMAAVKAVEKLLDPSNRAGAVNLPGGVTPEDVHVVHGKTVFGIYHHLSVASCYMNAQKKHCISSAAFRNAVAKANPAQLGVPEWAYHAVAHAKYPDRKIEGLILPGVHVFNPTHSPLQIIHDLVTASAEIYQQSGLVEAAKKQKLSPYEIVTGASLIQREVGVSDYGKVARVIVNRLNRDQPLQFDSTVNYGLSEQQVATTDADRAAVTPWNTYAKKGLPATPICSPTMDAVHAMENPTPGDWLYFVTVDKRGTTKFNATLKGHERDIKEAHRNGVFDSQ